MSQLGIKISAAMQLVNKNWIELSVIEVSYGCMSINRVP